jgi:ankyrin repeat protein
MNNKLNIKLSVINTVLSLFLLLGCKPVSLKMQDERDIPTPSPSGEEAILSMLREKKLLGNLNKALLWALENDQSEVAKWLINEGYVDVDAKNDDECTPLHFAAEKGHTEMAELLIKKGADVNAKDEFGCTPLHKAAYNGHIEVVKLLIKAGADVEVKDDLGHTPMIWAIREDKTGVEKLLKEVEEELIKSKVKSKEASKPLLQVAAEKGHTAMVELLAKAGSDMSVKKDSITKTLSHLAGWNGYTSSYGKEEEISILKREGLSGERKKNEALFWALQNNETELARWLIIRRGANVNKKNKNGSAPLHWAAWWGNTEVAKLLIKAGVNVNDKDKYGWTPLRMAMSRSNDDVAEVLRRNGGVK